jgi:hypothetical protein
MIKLVGLHNTYQFDLFSLIHQCELIAAVLEDYGRLKRRNSGE